MMDFKKEFKNYKVNYKKDTNMQKVARPKWYYFLNVILYFVLPFFLGALLGIVLVLIFPGKKEISQEVRLSENIYLNDNNLGFAYFTDYTELEKQIKKLDISYYKFSYNGKKYYFLYNKENKKIYSYFKKDGTFSKSALNDLLEKKPTDINGIKYKIVISYQENLKLDRKLSKEKYNKLQYEKTINVFPFLDGCKIDDYLIYNKSVARFFNENLLMILTYTVLFALFFGLLFKELKVDFIRFYENIEKDIFKIIIAVAVMFIASIFSTMFVDFFSKMLKYDTFNSNNQRSLNLSLISNYAYFIVIIIAIFAPFIEELVFRKAMFNLFPSDGYSLYFSSLIFGIIHILGEKSPEAMLINIIPYFFAGLALGGMYLFSKKNIWVPIYAHLIWNVISLLV